MTLLMFILGMLLILGIARYNKSNKLFWILFVAFTSCFAGTKLVYGAFSEKEQSETSLNQAYPTQGLTAMENAFVCIFDNMSSSTSLTTSNPVGQASTPDYVENLITLCDVPVVTYGIYLHTLANPPNGKLTYDTS